MSCEATAAPREIEFPISDGTLRLLDQEGQLAIARVTPEDLEVPGTARVPERVSWTIPTLVSNTLYVRDRKHIMALHLSQGPG